MTTTLTFNDEADDQLQLLRMLKAMDLSCALFDIEQMFRSKLKYDDNLTDEEEKTILKIQGEFIDILDKYNISIDSLLQ